MSKYKNTRVIAGPVTLLLSATTMGHTDAGVAVTGKSKYNEVTSHESGDVPIAAFQIGPRRWELEFTNLEISSATFSLLVPDAIVSGADVSFENIQFGKRLTALGTIKVMQQNSAGTVCMFKLNNAFPMPDTLKIEAKNANNSKWMIAGKFVGQFIGTSTTASSAVISGLA